MQSPILELQKLGPLPTSDEVLADPNGEAMIARYQGLLEAVKTPVTDDEARILVKLFSSGDAFELDEVLADLIETAPHWPLEDCFQDTSNTWVESLKIRADNLKRYREKQATGKV